MDSHRSGLRNSWQFRYIASVRFPPKSGYRVDRTTHPASGAAPDSRILDEQCRQLYVALPSILIVSSVAALLLFSIHLDLQPLSSLLIWLSMFVAVTVTRALHGLRFRRDRPRGAAALRWYRRYFWLTFASAVVWGSGALVFFAEGHEGHLALLAFVVAGLGAGGIVNLAPRWQCAWVFLLPALLPYAARFKIASLPLSDEIAVFVLVYIGALMIMSRQFSAGIQRRIRGGLAQIDQAEESSRERQRYQSLVESTQAILWEGEPGSNQFTYVSPEAEGLLGYPASRWVAEQEFWLDHLHPEDREWVPEFCQRAAEESEDHTFDYRMIAADGREVWLHAVVKIIVADGQPVKHVGVMIDISELKAAQQGQEYLASLQRLMVNAARDFLSSGDDDFDRILSRTLEKAGRWCGADRSYLMRFTPDLSHYTNTHEWVADGITAEMHNLQHMDVDTIPELFSRLRRKRPAVLPDVDALGPEWRVEKELFQSQDIQSLIVLPIFRGDTLAGLVGFDSVRSRRDWTAREIAVLQLLANLVGAAIQHSEMEQRLRASETLRANAEALAGMGSWEWEVGSDRFNGSDEWRRVTGCGPGELTREQVLELTPEPERDEVRAALRATVNTGQAYDVEHAIIRPDTGERRWIKSHAELHPGGDDKLVLRGFAQDITARREAESKLFELAHYDSLTGMPNRLLVLDRLRQSLRRSHRGGNRVAVLFLDLDQFKKVNDTMGHDAGDQALVEAAGRLVGLFREQDTVARIGGDEFVIVLDDFSGLSDVTSACAKVLEAFRRPLVVGGREFMLTASIGIAVAPDDGVSARDLMRNADTAMYHAKNAGRDAWQFFTPSMNERVTRQLAVENALRGAVQRGEFRVEYQPMVRLGDRRIVGAEALARWTHPELGAVPPDEFIEIAEQCGLIGELGQFVVDDAIARLEVWRTEFEPSFCVSVNVSPRQFRDAHVADLVIQALDRSGLDGAALELEVTEGLLLSGRREVFQALRRLRERGVGLVMDDFGTGYASLSYLRDYPFSSIKIDRGFVEGLEGNPRNRKLVTSAIRLGLALELKVIAEGVEQESELDVLVREGCTLAQGYLFGRPMPPGELGELLRRQ